MEEKAIELWNRQDSTCVINLVPPAVEQKITQASLSSPELFQLEERALWRKLRSEENTPTPTDNRLRLKFWDEYDRAQAEGRKMNMGNVYIGVCSPQYFSEQYFKHPSKVAWLMCPPASYETKMEEALAFGIEQLRDILDLPNVLPNGRPDTKLMELKAKIVAMMDIRVKGATVQKIEQRNMNLNVSTSDKQVARAALDNSMESIQKKLKELELRDKRAMRLMEQAAENAKEVEVLDD